MLVVHDFGDGYISVLNILYGVMVQVLISLFLSFSGPEFCFFLVFFVKNKDYPVGIVSA